MKKLLLSFLLLSTSIVISAQLGVGIGTVTPAASAQLEVASSNKGFLPPRIALTGTADITTISSPVAGLLIYNIATAGTSPSSVFPGFYYYSGTEWQRFSNMGNAAGDLQYWNGTQWVMLPAGTSGAGLFICNGIPQWGPCTGGAGGLPTITTTAVSSINADRASSGGDVTGDGGALITARGVCVSTSINPSLANRVFAAVSTGPGQYASSMTGLNAGTTYFVRAYATNTNGTAYGANYSFTTLAGTAPTVVTHEITNITQVSATIRSQITSNGNGTITASGVCYATTANPTLANSVATGTTTLGVYYSNISGLSAGTLYHVRAYATNASGTAYGADSVFTTLAPILPTITTNPATNIGYASATVGGNISFDGGTQVTERGVCHSNLPDPTTDDAVIVNSGTGAGTFSDTIFSGLPPSSVIHARAYAVNSVGKVYGQDISFTTLVPGGFTAKFSFDSVKTNSGIIDPTPLPSILGTSITPFTVVGAGGPGFNSTSAGRFSFTNWSLGASNGSDVFTSISDTLDRYYELYIQPHTTAGFNLSSLSFRVQRSGTGARQFFVRTNANNYSLNMEASISPANSTLSIVSGNKFQITDAATGPQDGCTINFTPAFAYTNINYPFRIRIYGINAEAPGGSFSIDDVIINGTTN